MSEPLPPLHRSRSGWLLVAVFALEFLLFDQFGARRHTGVYPRWDDQVQYLSESYIAYERSRSDGFVSALRHAVLHPSAQGTLHDAAALIAFTLAGPSRSAALSLNIAALIAWQAALFLVVARLSASRPVALAAALLPLALAGPWENIPGSAYDFRLDHFAMCAMGVTSAVALTTEGFRRRGPSLLFGLGVAVVLLTRFLSGTYLVLIFAGLIISALLGADRRARLANLSLAALIPLLLAGPILWLSRERVLDYYWIGHFVGPESAVRAAHMNVSASLAFVFRHLGERHLGVFFAVIAGLGLVTFALARGRRFRAPEGIWLIGLLFVLAPALVFTLHRQKSEVVLSALVPGVVLLVIAAWLAVRVERPAHAKTDLIAPLFLATLVGAFFIQRQLRPAYDPSTLDQIRQVNRIADTLHTRITTGPLPEAGIAVDHINDALNAEVLRVIFYERQRVWLPIKMTLPTGVTEPGAEDVMQRLARSQLVLLTDEPAPGGRYPFDQKLHGLRPQLRAWCDTHLRRAERFTLFGRTMTLYQHAEIPFAPARP